MTQTKQSQKIEFLILVGLLKIQIYNAKITKIEGKIPSISASATNAALTTVENKIPDVSRQSKKQIITEKLLKLKINLLIIIITNILLLQGLTS